MISIKGSQLPALPGHARSHACRGRCITASGLSSWFGSATLITEAQRAQRNQGVLFIDVRRCLRVSLWLCASVVRAIASRMSTLARPRSRPVVKHVSGPGGVLRT